MYSTGISDHWVSVDIQGHDVIMLMRCATISLLRRALYQSLAHMKFSFTHTRLYNGSPKLNVLYAFLPDGSLCRVPARVVDPQQVSRLTPEGESFLDQIVQFSARHQGP